MKYSVSGLHLTEQFEGCRLTAYQDSKGVFTIGYGHTRNVHQNDTCTQAEAELFLQQDVSWAEDIVNNNVTTVLTQPQFDALVDFVFNVGSGNFLSSTLLKLLNAGDFEGASNQFVRWDRAGGQVLAGLLRRRNAEKEVFDD